MPRGGGGFYYFSAYLTMFGDDDGDNFAIDKNGEILC